jgi:hypothetical protein
MLLGDAVRFGEPIRWWLRCRVPVRGNLVAKTRDDALLGCRRDGKSSLASRASIKRRAKDCERDQRLLSRLETTTD